MDYALKVPMGIWYANQSLGNIGDGLDFNLKQKQNLDFFQLQLKKSWNLIFQFECTATLSFLTF